MPITFNPPVVAQIHDFGRLTVAASGDEIRLRPYDR